MQQLRAETAGHHARAEEAMPSIAELATSEGYAEAIRLMHGFHALWEPAIWSAPGVAHLGLDPHLRRKLPLLERDLNALRLQPLEVDPAAAPRLDLETSIGSLYVLEGATLGGRVILKQLRKHRSLDASNGAAYYTGYAERTGEHWQDFGGIVDRHTRSAVARSRVVEGARKCFSAFHAWIVEHREPASGESAARAS